MKQPPHDWKIIALLLILVLASSAASALIATKYATACIIVIPKEVTVD